MVTFQYYDPIMGRTFPEADPLSHAKVYMHIYLLRLSEREGKKRVAEK